MLQVELKVLEGRQQGKTIPLSVRQFLIGREQDCHLRPNSDLVSRHHCVFTVDDFTVRLRDLGSTNGTYVNGERLQGQVVLKPGDHVVVGKLSFEIVLKDRNADVKAPPAPADAPPVFDPAAETSVNVSDTMEFPAEEPDKDTAIIGTFPPAETLVQQPAGTPPQGYPVPQFAQPAYGMPQGYALPPGYPMGYPGYMPQGYPPGYGPPPGYMVPGYPMQPGMAMPGYGMPQQGQVSEAAPSTTGEPPPIVLPDPSETGAKPAAPPPPAAPLAEGQPVGEKKPSEAAADIIRSHRTRRAP